MSKKHKPVDLRVIQAESSLRRLCKDKHQCEKYILPPENETREERFLRRRKILNSVLTKEEKLEKSEKNKASRKTKRNTAPQRSKKRLKFREIKEKCDCADVWPDAWRAKHAKCEKSEWAAPPHCKDIDLPQKEKFEVTGRGGSPVYASANVREAIYISENVQFLEPEVFYCKRDDEEAIKHMFSVNFNNLKTDGVRFECTLKLISSCEIYFNGFKVGTVTKSYNSFAELLPQSDFLSITHKFTFEHGSTHWGQYESFSLNLSYGPLPKHVAAEIRTNLHPKTHRLNNFCYRQISCQGMSSIEFVNIHFRETCMNPSFGVSRSCTRKRGEKYGGDHLYTTAFKAVMEKKRGRQCHK